ADQQTGQGGATGGGGEPAVETVDDATGSRAEYGAGFRADHRRSRPFSPWQTSGQLSGTDSAGGEFGRTAEAGRHQQARQSHAALAAGGSGAGGVGVDWAVSHTVATGCSHRRIMVAVRGRIDGWWKRSSTEM